MPESNKPFVITDRRKFTMEGELRPDADPKPEGEEAHPAPSTASAVPIESNAAPEPTAQPEDSPGDAEERLPPPTAEQMERSRAAYEATADRLDAAIRAANPGMEHPPQVGFTQLVQSLYMTAIMQLGGATPEGEQPQVDLMGARQSVDMLAVLSDKTSGNLSDDEIQLLDSALFELRMAFLEITQALARSAVAKGPAATMPGGPSIVR